MVKTPYIENPILNLFKSFFPSWKLFDESVNTPILLYRIKVLEHFTDWQICIRAPKIKWFHLILNPHGNYYLAHHSHIQQLLSELSTMPDQQLEFFHQQVSYKITENFVRYEMLKKGIENDFQFKLSNIKNFNEKSFQIIDDILISPVLKYQYRIDL
ncbi:MAG: hypothetical protein Q7U04_10055 [Bacteriovorax sp.]|nr:hypothetical protein [Bacteriovorax sp.]